ncbi:MAG: glycosyltransferase family 2 protein [Nanoarchaeota archaeon]
MKLSFVLPTYNNAKTLNECLQSIYSQNFDKNEFEVILIDGGSNDETISIAKKYPTIIKKNPKRVEDNARIIGINAAKAEIVAFVDADNILVGKEWIKNMLAPFEDKEIVCADTFYFGARKTDPMKVRYQALIGGDDPIASYLGFHSRWCYFKNNWTDFPHLDEKKKGYTKVILPNPELIPSIGSNGFLFRKKIFKRYFFKTQLHPDYIYEMIKDGHKVIAKVDAEIIHNQPTFFKNKLRRIKRRMNGEIRIEYHYGINNWKMFKTALWIGTLIPLTYDIINGYLRKRDSAWLFHYPASIGLLLIYGFYKVREIFGSKIWR